VGLRHSSLIVRICPSYNNDVRVLDQTFEKLELTHKAGVAWRSNVKTAESTVWRELGS
jgi:hypothetical protein